MNSSGAFQIFQEHTSPNIPYRGRRTFSSNQMDLRNEGKRSGFLESPQIGGTAEVMADYYNGPNARRGPDGLSPLEIKFTEFRRRMCKKFQKN